MISLDILSGNLEVIGEDRQISQHGASDQCHASTGGSRQGRKTPNRLLAVSARFGPDTGSIDGFQFQYVGSMSDYF